LSISSSRPSVVARYVVAALLGAAAFGLNQVSVPLLSSESPEFILGGALSLFAFARLGLGPGLLAVAIALAGVYTRGDAVGIATLVYVLEAAFAWRLRRRIGSLILAVLVFWFTGGIVLDAVLYHLNAGLPGPYVTVLFVKQVLNALLNGVIAELLLALGFLEDFADEDAGDAIGLQRYVFARLTLVVVIPVTVLALFFTRTTYESTIAGARERAQRAAWDLSVRIKQLFEKRGETVGVMARRLSTYLERGDSAGARELLVRLHRENRQFRALSLLDSGGTARIVSIDEDSRGRATTGRNVSGRRYFREARSRLSTAYSPMILAALRLRDTMPNQAILLIAEPLINREGAFAGVFTASFEVPTVLPLLMESRTDAAQIPTVTDQEGHVVVSLDSRLRSYTPISAWMPAGLPSGRGPHVFQYSPPADTSRFSRMGIDIRHSVFQPEPLTGWNIFVDVPAIELYGAMMRSTYGVLALFLLTFVVLYVVVARTGRTLTKPFFHANAAATEIAGSHFEPRTLADLAASPILEARAMAEHLSAMAVALEQKRAQSKAREEESEQRFRTTFEHAAVGIAHVDPNGRYVRANARFCEIVGEKRDAIIGAPIQRYSVAADVEAECTALRELLDGSRRTFVSEQRMERPDGVVVPVQITMSAVRDASGATKYLIRVVEDLSERKKLEAQLRQSQKMEAVGRLAGGIAHDFNNLLTPIIGYCDFIEENPQGTDDMRSDVAEIRKAAQRARRLIQQLLAFGSRQMLDPQLLDTSLLLRDFQRLLRPLVREDIHVELRIPPLLWPIHADPGQVDQVLLNLAVNAIDAMPEGGTLSIEATNVDKALTGPGAAANGKSSFVRLRVRDTGVGMEPAVLSKIFEPFFTTKSRGKGTGLGLATVYGIVKQHEGEIFVYSTAGHGTTVDVYLPRGDGQTETAGGRAGTAQATSQGSGTTILVVEDEPLVRRYVCATLTRQGYHVLEAADPNDALRLGENPNVHIDLMLTDVIMPGLNGRQLYERLSIVRPDLRVIFMSGYTDDVLAGQGVEPHTLLNKPFEGKELVAVIDRALGALRS
jgi:PAS domain S-box-containing protein